MTDIEEHDLGLSHDLPLLVSRRRALGLLAGGLGATALAACGSSDDGAPATTPRAGWCEATSREPRGGDGGALEAADLPDRPTEGCVRRRLRHRRLRAERPEPRPNLARRRHGVQRRLCHPARGPVGLAQRRDRGQAQRRRL